jgi:hypothetical protein
VDPCSAGDPTPTFLVHYAQPADDLPHDCAQTASLRAELLKDRTELKPVMMAIAAAMPEDPFTFKSTPAQRDYGQQIRSVTRASEWSADVSSAAG